MTTDDDISTNDPQKNRGLGPTANFPRLAAHLRDCLLPRSAPAAWDAYLAANVALTHALDPETLQRIRDRMPHFIAQTSWQGCNGLEITEEIQVTIAAQACLLVSFQDTPVYWDLDGIHVYPSATFTVPRRGRARREPSRGQVIVGATSLDGPVILAWDHVLADSRGATQENVVLHELAHKLDLADAIADGVPQLANAEQRAYWERVCRAAYDKHRGMVEVGWPTLTGDYGATSQAEFFAVATEAFFMRPQALAQEHPEMFALLSAYYRIAHA